MKPIASLILVLVVAFHAAAYAAGSNAVGESSMKVHLEIEGKIITATLNNSAAAKDFAAMLPITLTLKDYSATEKVSDLPGKLSTTGAPAGIAPDVGDITYYAPWGNLAIFYRDFSYSKGLIKLGKIDSDIEALNISHPFKVTIRPAI